MAERRHVEQVRDVGIDFSTPRARYVLWRHALALHNTQRVDDARRHSGFIMTQRGDDASLAQSADTREALQVTRSTQHAWIYTVTHGSCISEKDTQFHCCTDANREHTATTNTAKCCSVHYAFRALKNSNRAHVRGVSRGADGHHAKARQRIQQRVKALQRHSLRIRHI